MTVGTDPAPDHLDRVVVTGAAGLIGRAVLDLLQERGISATALVLADPGDLKADRVIVGNAGDPVVARDAVADADAVVHLAAIPSPVPGREQEVFAGNTAATFAVLEAAGRAGITRATIASSINALGLRYTPVPGTAPASLPWDVSQATAAADPYSMSKWVDEFTAAAMARRHGMSVVCLRYPYVMRLRSTALSELDPYVGGVEERLAGGATDLWLYLDVRDAAAAALAGLAVPGPGAVPIYVAAPTTFLPYPTEQVLDRYWPQVPRTQRLEGRAAPVDLAPMRTILGIEPKHVLHAELVDLPPAELLATELGRR